MVSVSDNGLIFNNNLRAAIETKIIYCLWQDASIDTIGQLYLKHNIWNGMTAYKRNKNSVEAWSFGATPSDIGAYNYYINNLPYLEDFIIYFNQAAENIIDLSEASKLAYFTKKVAIDPFEKYLNPPALFSRERLVLLKDLQSLTKRELECLSLLGKAKTAKEVGNILGITYRVIEKYRDNIRSKLKLPYKKDLINYYQTHKFLIDSLENLTNL